eukprot:scaffold62914_cov28-Tisochrysis_lutea.AAC.3
MSRERAGGVSMLRADSKSVQGREAERTLACGGIGEGCGVESGKTLHPPTIPILSGWGLRQVRTVVLLECRSRLA